MKTVKQLQEERGAIQGRINAISDKAKAENRSVSAEELAAMQAAAEERDAKDAEIAAANFLKQEELRRAADEAAARPGFSIGGERNKGGEAGEKRQKQRDYSYMRAVRSLIPNSGIALEGLEKEMHDEASKEARDSGIVINGVGVPQFIARGTDASIESRDSVVGTTTAGGHTVATDLGQLINVLVPNLVTERLGVQMMPGMVGNFDLPKQTAYSSAAWETEQGAADETGPTFGKISLSPKRLAAFTDFSIQLLRQSSIGIENLLRADLNRAIAIAVDSAVISGTGSGQPTGILTFLDSANTVVGGTNGAAPDYDDIIDLEKVVDVVNALAGSLAYLTTPGIKGKLKKTKIDAGSGLFVWGQDSTTLNGYRAEASTQVPSTLDKGTSSDVCHAIIFGNWADYVLASWGPLDLIVDPYTLAGTGSIRITANSFWDGNSRHDESFSAMIDALAS